MIKYHLTSNIITLRASKSNKWKLEILKELELLNANKEKIKISEKGYLIDWNKI